MEAASISNVLKIVSDFGLVGLIIFLWWADNKRLLQVMDQHKKEMAEVLAQYQRDMVEQREMYHANASLCRDFSSIATDLRDIVTMNIQTMTNVDSGVRHNQFCPMLRIHEEKIIGPDPHRQEGA